MRIDSQRYLAGLSSFTGGVEDGASDRSHTADAGLERQTHGLASPTTERLGEWSHRSRLAEMEREYKASHSTPARPQFHEGVDSRTVSDDSLRVLNAVALASGVDVGKLLVTSSVRSPEDQARIMFEQLQAGNISNYGPAGRQLIEIYQRGPANSEDLAHIREAMAHRARELFEQGVSVSNHLGDHREVNVFDVAASSVPVERRRAFHSALVDAERRGEIRRFFSPFTKTYDPAFHFEVVPSNAPSLLRMRESQQLFFRHERFAERNEAL